MNLIRILVFCFAAVSVFAADVAMNWAVVLRPTALLAGQQQLGQLGAGAIVPVSQVAANGYASVATEIQGKIVTGWVPGSDLWLVGAIKPDAEWVFQKGLEFTTQARLPEAIAYVSLAAQMLQPANPFHFQTRQILEAIGGVIKSRAEKMPRVTEKLNRATQLEKEGAFRMQAKSISGKGGGGEREGAEKISQGKNLRAEAATEKAQLDNEFYNAMNDVGGYVDNLGAAGAWDIAVALESMRMKFLGEVSADLLKRSGAGATRHLSTDTQVKQPFAAVAQKVAFAHGCLVEVYRHQQGRELAAALAAVDKGLETFPHHRLLQKVRLELLPSIDKARELMGQVVAARQAGDIAKAEQIRQQALEIVKDADQLTPVLPPAAPPVQPATNVPPAAIPAPPAAAPAPKP